MGSPIDPTASGGKIQNWLSLMPDQYFENVIDAHDGIWPGEQQLFGFKMLNPADRFMGTYGDLMTVIRNHDEAGIKKWIRNNSWYETVLDLPGQMIREVIPYFRNSPLVKGEMTVLGKPVDLSKITCPVATITGTPGTDKNGMSHEGDDITNGDQCRNLLKHVSSKIKIDISLEAHGHIALFLTNEAMDALKNIVESF